MKSFIAYIKIALGEFYMDNIDYFSIDCAGDRGSPVSCKMAIKQGVNKSFLQFSLKLEKGHLKYPIQYLKYIDAVKTLSNIYDVLDDLEERYPNDTWLEINLYDEYGEPVFSLSDHSENGYALVMDKISRFLLSGDVQCLIGT